MRVTMPVRRMSLLRALMAATIATACSEGTGPAAPTVASITLAQSTASLAVGAELQLVPQFRDENGAVITAGVDDAWSSSNTTIASVDQTGIVTAHALGAPVTITVQADAGTASAVISVRAERINFPAGVATLALGTSRSIVATPVDYAGVPIPASSLTTVTWSTTNAAVATIDPVSGLLNGVSVGFATIVATGAGMVAQFDLEVGVPTASDGTYAGLNQCATCGAGYPVSISLVFGSIKSFQLVFSRAATPGICAYSVDIGGTTHAPITSSTFALTFSNPTFAVNGTVTGT